MPTQATDSTVAGLRAPRPRMQAEDLNTRRPMMSSQQPVQNVIDLTREPAGPARTDDFMCPPLSHPTYSTSHLQNASRDSRHSRGLLDTDIVDNTVDLRDSSPDLEIVQVRQRSRSAQHPPLLSRQPHHHRRHHSGLHQTERPAVLRHAPSNRTDPSVSVRLPSLAHALRLDASNLGAALMNRIGLSGARDQLVAVDDMEYPQSFRPPSIDFSMQGFNLDTPARPVQQPRLPTYESPPPAHEGYTRDLNPDDMLVCPNCDEELGLGETDDQRQVWVTRCGHVYCGECARNRSVGNKKQLDKHKDSSPSKKFKPFKKCVVEHCLKTISGKNGMFQVYL